MDGASGVVDGWCGSCRPGCQVWHVFSCICWWHTAIPAGTSVAMQSHHLSTNLNTASWTSATGCLFANRLKLNADKTELLFTSSGHNCATLSGKFSVLHLGADIVIACSHVHLLAPTSLLIRAWISTSLTPAWSATTDSINSNVVGGHWPHSSMSLWIDRLITAMLFLLVHQEQWWTSYNMFWTQLHVSSLAHGSFTAAWIRYCNINFTGLTSQTRYFSSWW